MKLLSWLFGASKERSAPKTQRKAEPSWQSWKPKGNIGPPKDFVWMPDMRSVNVAGTSHRTENCRTFLAALKGGRADEGSILVEADDSMPDHPNAIAVYGTMKHGKVQIGYLPSDVSAGIAAQFSRAMPLRGALREWGKKNDDDAYFFRVALFMPDAKGRKSYVHGRR